MAFSRIPSNDSWVVTATVFSSLVFSSNDVFAAVRRRTSEFISFFSPSSSIRDSSVDVLVIVRRLMFCAFELLDSSLSLLPRRPFLTRPHSLCGSANSPAVLPMSSLLLTFLSTSFASASFNTSLLRFRRSAPTGVVLRHSSVLTLMALQPGRPAVVPQASMSVLVILTKHWWWWQWVHLCQRPVRSPLAVNNSPRDSDHIVDGLFVPPLKLFNPPDFACSEDCSSENSFRSTSRGPKIRIRTL